MHVARIILCLHLLTALASAEAPDVSFLFPSGVQQGQSRTLTLHGKTGTAPTRGWTSHESVTLTPSEDGKQATLTAAADALPGVYWGRIANGEGVSKLLPLVVGVLPETVEADWQNEAGPQPVALPTTISGVLSKGGEVDSFNVALEAGQTLVASIDSHRLLASPADMVLQLASEAGFVIRQNDDHHEIDPQLVYTAKSAETVAVRVFSFPADPNSTIGLAGGEAYVYRLTLTTGPFVDHVLPLVAAAGSSGVQPFGWNLPDDSSLLTIAAAAEPVSLSLSQPGTLLTNRIDQTTLPTSVETADSSSTSPMTIPIPGSVSGRITEQGEVNSYFIDAVKDQKLLVSASARRFDAPLDPVLRVRDADGKLIKEFDDVSKDNADALLALTISAEGRYRLEVRDRFGHGGLRYVYLLQVELDQPRYKLSIKDSRYTVAAGKTVEVPVTVERLAGFKEPVTITVEGLPEGVTAAAIESAPEGETSKEVKLTIEAGEAVQFGGPIRIVGRSGDASQPATTAAPVTHLTIDNVWLTVTPAPKPDGANEPKADASS